MSEQGSQRWIWIGTIGGVLIVALAVWLLFIRGPSVPSLADDEGRVMAEKFLDEVRAGQVNEAWESTSTEFKSFQGKETFRKLVKSKPAFKSTVKFEASETPKESDTVYRVYRFRPVKGTGIIAVSLAPEDDTWRVVHVVVE